MEINFYSKMLPLWGNWSFIIFFVDAYDKMVEIAKCYSSERPLGKVCISLLAKQCVLEPFIKGNQM